MKKYACQYAIVRFLPYLETGEFANVGIVMCCPDAGFFDFKLLTRIRRITAFFEELDAGIYRRARGDFQQELQRIGNWLNPKQGEAKNAESARHLFAELTRPREVMMRFEGVRVVLADDPAQQLEDLFGYYVERNFATKAYQEQLLDKTVRKVLVDANLGKQFQAETVGNTDSYHAKFPFVHQEEGRAIKAIKPLHLAQADPVQIYDHGWAWLGKVQKLRALRVLPERVLFPVQGPTEADGERFEIFQDIAGKLAANDVQVVATTQTEKIVEFARG
jgi:plasmid stabilization system protein ParE